MYRENTERQQFRERSFSLKDFVKGLQLSVEIAEATENQLGRVSQLTFRTNQFNFTTIRRSENDIKRFLMSEGGHCLVVRVVDRFGDYGLVGVIMYETEADRYKLDTLLLSCRVLGRGVEHAVVSWLGYRALMEGKGFVELTYRPTEKNSPALQFITSIGDDYRNASATSWIFPAERLAAVDYNPDEQAREVYDERQGITKPEKVVSRRAWMWDVAQRSERLQRIGDELCDVEELAKAIEQHRLSKECSAALPDVTPSSILEISLL